MVRRANKSKEEDPGKSGPLGCRPPQQAKTCTLNCTLPGADISEEFAGDADVSIALLSFS